MYFPSYVQECPALMDTCIRSGHRKQTSAPAAKQRRPSSTSYLGVVNGTSSGYNYWNRQRQEEGAYPSSSEAEQRQNLKNSGSQIYQQSRQRFSTLLQQEGSIQPIQTSSDNLQALTDGCRPLRTRKCYRCPKTRKPTRKLLYKIPRTHKVA